MEIAGRPDGIPPYVLPIVARGIARRVQTTVVRSIATIEPGTFLVTQGQSRTIESVIAAVIVAAMLTELAERASRPLGHEFATMNWLSTMS